MGSSNWMRSSFTPGLASVIIPTHNRAQLLIETLESVKVQTHRPVEIIVVDDGSEDDTAERVEEWRGRNQNDRLAVHYERQSNQGANAARNRGLELCSGEFIQLLDSDDLIHPDKISASIRDINERHVSVVVGHVVAFRRQSDIGETWPPSPNFRPHAQEPTRLPYLTRLRWDGVVPLYTRSVIRRLGPFSQEVGISGSAEYAFRVKLSQCPVHYAPNVLYYYRLGLDQAATKSSISRITASKLKLIDTMSSGLASHQIEEKAEWKELTIAALTTAYRAYILGGLKKECYEAVALARGSARHWNGAARFCLSVPEPLILAGMTLRHWLTAAMRDKPH
jgi:glycosyltransferase involved in cell wall biosynthesis